MALLLDDKTSNANNLTNNGATEVTTGLPFPNASRAAKVVAASSQYLYAPDANQLSVPTTGKMTIEFWCNPTTLNNNNYPIFKGDSGFEYGIVFGNANGAMQSNFWSSAGDDRYVNISANSIISAGTWYHAAVTIDNTLSWNAGNVKIYVDEVEKTNSTSGSSGNALSNTASQLDIGARVGGSQYGNLQILDLRIWNTVRTPTELTNNKNDYLVGNETGLVAYYPFGNKRVSSSGFFALLGGL